MGLLIRIGQRLCAVGSQYHIEIGGQDYYLDLLFYHLKIPCYVIIDLKMAKCKSEDSGKMNFYLAAVDDLLRHPTDQPTINLILCKTHNRIVSEYALRGMSQRRGPVAAKARLTAGTATGFAHQRRGRCGSQPKGERYRLKGVLWIVPLAYLAFMLDRVTALTDTPIRASKIWLKKVPLHPGNGLAKIVQ